MPAPPRAELRRRLLDQRARFVADAGLAAPAGAALAEALVAVIARLEPGCLGLYWPTRSEFNAAAAILDCPRFAALPLALPFTRKSPREMVYRRWDRSPLIARDECNIACSEGAGVVPDVVLAPCVGYTASGLRLGYGGGYFDRWMAAHPAATVLGVAWSIGRLDDAEFVAEAHDRRLIGVVTESGMV